MNYARHFKSHRQWLLALTVAMAVGACSGENEATDTAGIAPSERLPRPVANNAVAAIETEEGPLLFSFSGLGPGKTYADVHSRAWMRDGGGNWRRLPDVPGAGGRLASVAVAQGGRVLLFGGYTVAADGTEVSTPEVFAFEPDSLRYRPLAPMPVAVDDSVAALYRDRYVYLVSGWHDTDNVSLVQVYDAREDRWFRATDYPGPAVFGHAGGIVGNAIVIADGVRVVQEENGRRFEISDAAFRGTIYPNDPARIAWIELPPHPGPPLYRMAATGSARTGQVVFAGGSPNPYNYDGIGYDGAPSPANDRVFAYDPAAESWIEYAPKPRATMDHRGLLELNDIFVTLGGMTDSQEVSDLLVSFTLERPERRRN